jgi:pentatricopeptide repeat protein
VAADEWDSVLDVIEAMKRQGLAQERSTYRACLVECAKVGNGASAKEILNAMKQALVEPEPYDISLAIGAICRNGKHEPASWQQALALLKTEVEEIKSSSNVVPVEGYDAILSAMTEAKQWKEAVRLIRQMEGELPHEGLHSEPSVASYRSAIECCVRAGQAEQAVQLLHAMNKRGLIVSPSVHLNSQQIIIIMMDTFRTANHFLVWAFNE